METIIAPRFGFMLKCCLASFGNVYIYTSKRLMIKVHVDGKQE